MDYDPLQLFGLHLVELRKTRGWSQERLALESGLARSYVGGIERGQRNIALIILAFKLACRSLKPIVEAAGRYAQYTAHGSCGPDVSIFSDKAVLHLRSTAK